MITEKTISRKIDARINLLIQTQKDTNISSTIELIETVLKRGNKILIFGNGGSAAQSSHFAAEMVNKFYFERTALPAIALTTDTASLTSIANDSDYKYIFSRQIEALGKENDVAIGISTSGKSPNIFEAFKTSKKKRIKTIALCGKSKGQLKTLELDNIISVESDDTPAIQEIHLFVLHIIAEILEKRIFRGQ